MKRRSRQNVGQWPNMRDDTLKAVSDELLRARKKHPGRSGNVALLGICAQSLIDELGQNDQGKISALQVYARAAQVAALAVRVLEEGGGNYRYAGNTLAPDFPSPLGSYAGRGNPELKHYHEMQAAEFPDIKEAKTDVGH